MTLSTEQTMARALAHHRAGQLDDAAGLYRAILAGQPRHAEALHLLGVVHDAQGEPGRAASLIEAALRVRESAAFHCNLAMVLGHLGRHQEAVVAAGQALALRPDYPEATNNLGVSLDGLGRREQAVAAYRRAVAARPDYAEAWTNLGHALCGQGHLGQRAMLLLRQGRFAEGWLEYEWRLRTRQAGGTGASTGRPPWNGEPLEGRTILLTPEQGFGDTIQFSRYAPMVAARDGRVLLGAPRPLVRLLRGLPGVAEVVAEGEPVPAHALECPLLSLPRAFGTTLQTVPAVIPCLAAPPEALARWRERLPDGDGFRVGVAWAGNPNQANDRRRSLPFEALAPLWAVDGVRWHSLQVGPRAADLTAAPAGRIEDLAPELDDFAETAAAIARLDAVVTPDTAVAHLAGALGVPTLVMLSFAADWRWVRGQDHSRWYPGMRLVRQDAGRRWEPVIATVASMLADLARHCTRRVSGRG